jgi:hypothetical protein
MGTPGRWRAAQPRRDLVRLGGQIGSTYNPGCDDMKRHSAAATGRIVEASNKVPLTYDKLELLPDQEKPAMRRASASASCTVALTFMILGIGATAWAQSRDRYVIYSKAGVVNAVSGPATFQPHGSNERLPVTPRTELDSGDTVLTGTSGRVEFLLNPGSYMRLAENTEVELVNVSLDDLRLKLVRGSAIIEATDLGGAKVLAEITTPQTSIVINKKGLYRINVVPGATELYVRKGRAEVGTTARREVKGGRKIVVGRTTELARFDKKAQDVFDLWSQKRAELLAESNRRIVMSQPSSIWVSFSGNIGYSPYGLWAYDPFSSCYTFFPLRRHWSSPYGYSYVGGSYHGAPTYNPPGGSGSGAVAGSQPKPPAAGAPVEPQPGRDPSMVHPGRGKWHDPENTGDRAFTPPPAQREHIRRVEMTNREYDRRSEYRDRQFERHDRDSYDRGRYDRGSGQGHSEPARETPSPTPSSPPPSSPPPSSPPPPPPPSYTPPPAPPPAPRSEPAERHIPKLERPATL